MRNPFDIVKDFEAALCEYTGAPYAVAVNSCTMAILLAVKWYIDTMRQRDEILCDKPPDISIPKHTYVSVPMSIVHAGGTPVFRDENWHGFYRLAPLPVYDCARMLTSGMYLPGSMQCLSFHTTKVLGDTQGGAILLDDESAYLWLRRMRFDGRYEKLSPREQAGQCHRSSGGDLFTEIGYHCYLSPDVAARLLWKLQSLPKHNEPLPCDDYPDLSLLEIFK